MCTNFKIPTARDGSVVIGRSLEFPTSMPTALAVLPSDYEGVLHDAEGNPRGDTWTATYGAVGMCAFDQPSVLLDGMNTAGLAMHILYMPGYCEFQPYRGGAADVSEIELGAWTLGTCATVEEVKAALEGRNIWGADPGMGFVPPCHFLFHDKSSSIVLEFHTEGWRILDNPTSVATNSPYLEWHLENLRNFGYLSQTNPEGPTYRGLNLAPFGQGAGLRGLPGDYTGPGRFVRAVAFTALSDQPENGTEAELFALHILNVFDIPPGNIKEQYGEEQVDEVTVWDTISNLTGQRYAYRTLSDPSVYVVELGETDFAAPARVRPLSWNGHFTPISV